MNKLDISKQETKFTRLYNKNPSGQLICSAKTCKKDAVWMGKTYPLVVCEDHEQNLIDLENVMKGDKDE